jgi:hypothetical protein
LRAAASILTVLLHARSYFNRDNVSLPGFAAFYRASSLEERTHAQQLMDFQVLAAPWQPLPSPYLSISFLSLSLPITPHPALGCPASDLLESLWDSAM